MTTTFNVVRVENLDETQFDVTNADGRKKITIKKQDDIDLSNLPKVSWKDGTGILVKQDGALKQLVPARNLFQEVGVAMTGRKLSGVAGETYHVVVTVTNSGEATNEVTDLVITKPLLGTYRVENFTNSKSSGVTVEKLTDLTYKIKNLNSGGTAKVEFDVIPESAGSFQFGASVNPNNALDQQSNNNQSTITLSVATPRTEGFTQSVDCPFITPTYNGMQLRGFSKIGEVGLVPGYGTPVNIVDALDLENLRINVPENLTVIVNINTQPEDQYISHVGSDVLRIKGSDKYIKSYVGVTAHFVNATDRVNGGSANYTYENGAITLTPSQNGQKIKSVLISLKPRGSNCKWQHFAIQSLSKPKKTVTITTTLPNHTITDSLSHHTVNREEDLNRIKSYANLLFDGEIDIWLYDAYASTLASREKLEITLPAGRITTGTINITGARVGLNTKGNLEITYESTSRTGSTLSVTTTASISEADSLDTEFVSFKVT